MQGYARTLKAFFSWLEREGYITGNPGRLLRIPKAPNTIVQTFSDAQIKALLSVVDHRSPAGFRDYCIMLVLLDTGVRLSELVGLGTIDVDWERGTCKVMGKGSKERIVPLGQSSRRALATYIRRHRPEPALPRIDQVFLTQVGYPMKPDYVYKILAGACGKVGIRGKRLGPHTCRHTFARSFLMNGGDVLTLQRILGHASLEVVKLYVNLDTNDLLAQQRKHSPMDALQARRSSRG